MVLKIGDLVPLGDSALVIRFEQRIDAKINAQVLTLQDAIEHANIAGVEFLAPAYCSLTMGFDPLIISRDDLHRRIEEIVQTAQSDSSTRSQQTLSIPVCYDEEFAFDLEDVQSQTGLTFDGIIRHHTSPTYRVYMLGFLPGFAYLGKTPSALSCSRKSSARTHVPASSVGIAGRQTAIYPSDAPGGWQIIGRTPERPFDPARGADAFLFQPGDDVKFYPISLEEFEETRKADRPSVG